MAKAGTDLEAELDALYASPLAEFISARHALAKKVEAAGRKEDAARVKALKKPTPAAWAVNHLAFAAPKVLAALVAAGDRLRTKPPDVKDAMQKRRDAVNAARQAAEKALADAGRAANADVVRRVSATLEAIATFGSARGGPVAGRLAADVAAPGFDEVASLGLLGGGAGGARPRTVPSPSPPVKPPHIEPPKIPSKKNSARERALDEKRRRDEQKRAAAMKKSVVAARARLRVAEKAAEAVRRRKSSLQAALSGILFEEKRVDAELAAAKEASAKADAAERAARTPPT